METVKKILIPVDGSDRSKKTLKKGISLARLVSAKVTVMYVSENPLISPISVITLPAEKLRELIKTPVNNLLNHAKKECKNHNVSYSELIVEGQPSQCIIDASKDYDMIVISPLCHSMVTDLLMGSVAEKVIRHAKCSVIIVR